MRNKHWCTGEKCGRSVRYDFVKRADDKNYSCEICKKRFTKSELGIKRESHFYKASTKTMRFAKKLMSKHYQFKAQKALEKKLKEVGIVNHNF